MEQLQFLLGVLFIILVTNYRAFTLPRNDVLSHYIGPNRTVEVRPNSSAEPNVNYLVF